MVADGNRRTAAVGFLLSSYLLTGLALVKNFLFIPLYLRHFDLATYGGYLASSNVLGILGVLDIGMTTAFYQRLAFAHGGGDRDGFAKLSGSGIVILVGTAVIFGIVGLSIAGFVPGWIHASSESGAALARTFRLTSVGAAGMLLNQGLLAIPSAWQLSSVNAASRLGAQVVEMGMVLGCLSLGLGVESLGWGAMVGGLFGVMVTIWLVVPHWRARELPLPRPDRSSFRWLFQVGLPTLISRVVGQVAGNLEVALVSAIMGPSVAAMYGITERTFRMVQGFINPIVGSAFSGLSHLMGQQGPKALLIPLRELRGLYTLVVSVVVPCILIVNQDFVSLWVGPEKFGGTWLSSAIAVGTILSTQLFFLSLISSASGKIQATAYLTTLEAALRVPLIVAGLYLLGPAGMALFTSLGYAALIVFAYPGVIGRGLGLPAAGARKAANQGLGVMLAGILLGILAVHILPNAVHWWSLVVKGTLAGLAFLGVVVSISPVVKAQLGTIVGKVAARFR